MRRILWIVLATVSVFFLSSCNDDDGNTITGPSFEGKGTIIVDPEPGDLNASWQLMGPSDFDHTGTGSMTLVDLDAGVYSLTWGNYLDWTLPSPNPAPIELHGDATVTVSGTYNPPNGGLGTIAIDVAPDELNAAWSITGPHAYAKSGSGDASIFNVPEGEYSVTWSSYSEWADPEPNPGTFNVAAGITTTVMGVYEPKLPFPGTREQLMANFQRAYEDRDFDYYFDLLHPDFLMELQASTIAHYPDVGQYLELPEDLQIHQRMFSGENLTDPNGAFVPAVTSIGFQVLQRQDDWSESTNALFPSTDAEHPVERAVYDMIMLLYRGQTYSTLKVEGQVEFYITSRDSLHDGAPRRFYMMRGQRDLTVDFKAEESASLGDVKAVFR